MEESWVLEAESSITTSQVASSKLLTSPGLFPNL